ncbi:Protein RarD [Sinobacterium norvegicum]|uniref:Protein RarD n=1 Tax=Sinobacterium norvegicum TaxID=1641715 RepID=A0ABN8ECZ3_9GAMM|nr:EamA family transporter RarD [Sinobacterium norvegicum]CAH0990212.1 Protein RarD [Sinobacterium norvegicum]
MTTNTAKISTTSQGVIFSICSAIIFAAIPAYLMLLQNTNGYAAIGQRIIWTTLLIATALAAAGRLRQALKPLLSVQAWPGLLTGALLVGVQWGVFVWAPMMGDTVGLALGYSLLPISLVLIGRFYYHENLSTAQWLATAVAVSSVIYMIIINGSLSLTAMIVALGYPLYFMLRRKQSLPIVSAFLIENILLLPVAWWACGHFEGVNHPFDYTVDKLLLFAGLGLLGAAGMLCYLSANRRLPLALFGLLSYLEPPLILLVGIIIVGEQIPSENLFSYLLIGCALSIMAIDAAIKFYRGSGTPPQL